MKAAMSPSMKDSGVGWIGEIPDHWNILRMRFLCDITTGGRDTQDAEEDGQYPFFVRSQTIERISTWSFDGEAVLTSGDGVGVGKIFHHFIGKLEFHQRVYLFHNFRRVLGRFLYYFIKENLYKVVLEGAAKSTVDSLRRVMLQDFPITFPSIDEQQAVADFLDRKTAQIDSLIAKKQRMIELLGEKRQALISQAVTKGLDPNVPMKDSGIEWLGEIPQHWVIEKLKDSITKIGQGWSPQCENRPADEGEWGVLKVGCVNGPEFNPTEQKALPPELEPVHAYEIHPGDVLMSRGNTRELVGGAALVRDVRSRLLLCDLLYRFRSLTTRTDPEYLVLQLRSPSVRHQIEREATGTSSSMKKISQEKLRDFMVVLPPLDEQKRIVEYLRNRLAALDRTSGTIEGQVQKLQEYRQTLISAAVTGKIDVTKEAAR